MLLSEGAEGKSRRGAVSAWSEQVRALWPLGPKRPSVVVRRGFGHKAKCVLCKRQTVCTFRVAGCGVCCGCSASVYGVLGGYFFF